jgi:hypothetical protein
MAQATAPTAGGAGNVLFELERLEQSDDGLLELSGRWFGVRGRRFVRPTLTLVADGRPHRLLADLAHKPWAAEDGAEWTAAFPWDEQGASLTDIELSVAPDIAILLAGPDLVAGTAPVPADETTLRRELHMTRMELADQRRERERLRRELGPLREELDRLRDELEQAREAALEAESATARRDAAVAKLEAVEAQLADSVAAREAAVSERDRALAYREQAVLERDGALADRDQTLAGRKRSRGERDRALAERDRALSDRDQTARQRDQALAGRDQAVAERDRVVAERNRALAERDQALAGRHRPPTPLPVSPTAPEPISIQPRPTGGRHRSVLRRDIGWPARVVAIVLLIAVVVAFLLVARIL